MNGGFESWNAAVYPAPDLLVEEVGEDSLDKVDPRAVSGCEVQVIARSSRKPTANRRRLVGAIVVEDEVNLSGGRDRRIDESKKAVELLAPVATMRSTQNTSRVDVQSCEQSGQE